MLGGSEVRRKEMGQRGPRQVEAEEHVLADVGKSRSAGVSGGWWSWSGGRHLRLVHGEWRIQQLSHDRLC